MSSRFGHERVPHIACLMLAFFAAAVAALPATAQEGSWTDRLKGVFGSDAASSYEYDPALYSGLDWRHVGPWRGGRVTAVTGIPSRSHTFYMGTVGGGVWKSTNAGQSWTNVSDGFFATASVGAIAVAPSDPNVVYVGMGESPVRGVKTSHGDGVYKSTDGGKSWAHLGLEATHHISKITVHPSNPDLVYVAAQGRLWGPNDARGIYRSRDGGKSWEQILFVGEDAGASDLSMDPNNPRNLYAAFWEHRRKPWKMISGGPGSGLWKSTDGGESWVELTMGLPELMGKTAVTVSPADAERVYALIEADEGGVFRSEDGGRSWHRVNAERPIRMRSWYYTHIFAHPTDVNTVFALSSEFDVSVDGGRTFSPVDVPHLDTHDLWINPDHPEIMIHGDDGGATVSLDGGKTWSRQDNQPTAQLYRVSVDNSWPYRLYAGQQDNSTIVLPNRTASSGIGQSHWESAGGGESAQFAFDPDDPRYIYATSIIGTITEYDRKTGRVRNIEHYPAYPAFAYGQDLKYRFNWSAPVAISPHDPKVIYHGAQKVLKTEDRGRTWEEISPDLTRADPETLKLPGGPISLEGAGGEMYATLVYIVESPHEAGVIWTGSDDGQVSLTRDGGESWQDVTPEAVETGRINAIEVSPHDPATAYIAVDNHKLDDFTPYIYKTSDYGESWTRRTDGLRKEAFVRVIREDPVREGLLFAGTETGIFVSFNDGAQWQPLQLDLPVTPITDIKIQRGDVVLATGGRGFWILDDIAPLRQLSQEIASAAAHFFKPSTAYWEPRGSRLGGPGENPPQGAILYYRLAEDLSADDVQLVIRDQDGDAVTKIKGGVPDRRTDGGRKFGDEVRIAPLPVSAGMHRYSWDLKRAPLKEIATPYLYVSKQPPRVGPGRYTLELRVGDRMLVRSLEVAAPPNLADEDFTRQQALLARIYDRVTEIHDVINRLRLIRKQVRAILETARVTAGVSESVFAQGDRLIADLKAWEDHRDQPRVEIGGGDDVNFPNRLISGKYLYIMSQLSSSGPPAPAGVEQRLADLDGRWDDIAAKAESLASDGVGAFNALLAEHGLGRVVVSVAGPSPEGLEQ